MFCKNDIQDGYTQPGYIAQASPVHAALRFTFRPVRVQERSWLSEAAAEMTSQAKDREAATFVAEKLVAWDWSDAVGHEIAIAPESVMRLPSELFGKLRSVVLGWAASDVDPRWPAALRERLSEESALALASGRSIGEVREEQDEKN